MPEPKEPDSLSVPASPPAETASGKDFGAEPDQKPGRESGPEPVSGASPATAMPLTSANLATTASEAERIPSWLRYTERFLRVIVRIYIGLVVCLVPWFPPLWDANPLFARSPSLSAFIGSGAVRGLISGLGLLNLWFAVWEAIRGPEDAEHP